MNPTNLLAIVTITVCTNWVKLADGPAEGTNQIVVERAQWQTNLSARPTEYWTPGPNNTTVFFDAPVKFPPFCVTNYGPMLDEVRLSRKPHKPDGTMTNVISWGRLDWR